MYLLRKHQQTLTNHEYSQAPHRSPSISIERTHFSNATMSVSSSHGFTSRMILDLAITTFSARICNLSCGAQTQAGVNSFPQLELINSNSIPEMELKDLEENELDWNWN